MYPDGTRLVRYSAAKDLQQIMGADESDAVDSGSNDSSGSDYEDHVSETSEHNDITGPESAQDDMHPGTNRTMDTTSRSRGRGHCRGLRRGGALFSSTPMHQPDDEDVSVSAAQSDAPSLEKIDSHGKDNPHRLEGAALRLIVRTMPGVTSISRCSTILETMQLYLTPEIINNIVLQYNCTSYSQNIK
jgi:hypothetical protein